MNTTKLSEIIAPTRNIALNAIAFGTEDVTSSGLCTSDVNIAMNIPAVTGSGGLHASIELRFSSV